MPKIKKHIFLHLFVCFCVLFGTIPTAFSQVEPYDFKSQNVELPVDIFYYLDDSHQLDFQDISNPSFSNQFTKSKSQRFSFGKTKAIVWLRIEAHNQNHVHIKDWFLELGYPTLDSLTFYSKNQYGEFEGRLTGDFLKFNQRPIFDVNYVFPINLHINSKEVFYLRAESQGSKVFPIKVVSEGEYIKNTQYHTIFFGMFYGIMFIMLVYNLVIYFATKDTSYLLYVFALVGHLFFISAKNGHSYQFVLGNLPYLGNLFLAIGISMIVIGDVLFTKFFINTKQYVPQVDKFLSLLVIIGIGLFFMTFVVDYKLIMNIGAIITPLIIITLLTTGIRVWVKGNTSARFFVFAWTSYAIGLVIYVLNSTGLIPANVFTFYAIEIGSVLEITLLSLALVDKFRILRGEKSKAQEEILFLELKTNKELEKKVTERTLEINNQKEELHAVSESLTERNKYLIDSIDYAQTIQQAILPSQKSIDKAFNDHFILYKPKDIVSGDFYWFAQIENKTFIAVIDCTGHGVPGAFMSIVGASLLNKIIKELRILEPLEIFDRFNAELIETLKQGQGKNKDGMDACFCLLEETANEAETQLTYVGAKRPLFIHQGKEITEIRGTRKSIAAIQNKRPFKQEQLLLNKGDLIYLSTDGLVDQANEERERFGTDKLKKLLNEIAPLNMTEQKEIIEYNLFEHQQITQQRDDIAFIGIRI